MFDEKFQPNASLAIFYISTMQKQEVNISIFNFLLLPHYAPLLLIFPPNTNECHSQQRLGLVCIEYGKLDYKAMAWTFCEAQTLESGEV